MTTDSGLRRVLLASAVSSVAVLPIWLVGGLAVQIRADLRFTEGQLGLVTGTFMAVSALASIPAGVGVNQWGWRLGTIVSAAVTAGASLAVAGVPGRWGWLVVLLGLAGVSLAIAQPSANLMLVEGVARGRQGLAFGIKQTAVPVGTLLSGLAVPLIGITLGWRWAFAGVVALCALLVAAATPGQRRDRIAATERTPPSATPIAPGTRLPLVILAVGGGLGTASSNTLGAFTVVYAVSLGVGAGAAGMLLAAGSLANIAVRLILGWLADVRGGEQLRWVSAMMLLGAAGFLTLVVASGLPGLVVGVLGSFMAAWGWNGLYHLGIMRRYAASAASATGVVGTFLSVGGTLGPISFGLLADRFGFDTAWATFAATSVAAGALVLVGTRRLEAVRRYTAGGR